MKHAVKQPFAPAQQRHKTKGQQKGAQPLAQQRPLQHQTHQPDDAADPVAVHTLLQDAPLPQADLAPQEKGKQGGNGHEPQAADLNEDQDHHLSEPAPLGVCVHRHQARHAGRTGGCKQRIQHRNASVSGRKGTKQKQCPRCNHQKKSQRNNLRLGKCFFDHSSSP